MIKFKKTMTEKINQYRYYILTLVTMTVLTVTGFYFYKEKSQVPSVEEDVQFNFIIDGKNYIMPSPVHSFHFLNTMGFPWKGLAEASPNAKYETEAQTALNLGYRSADGTVHLFAGEKLKAVEARSTFIELAGNLNITAEVKDAISALDNAVTLGKDQNVLDDRIIQLEYQIEKALHTKKKENLAVLVELGAWLEGLHIASKGITNNYTPGYAEILRQPHIAEIYLDVLAALIHRSKDEKEKALLESIAKHLEKIAKITNHTHKESFPLEKVKQLNLIAIDIKKLIESNSDLPKK